MQGADGGQAPLFDRLCTVQVFCSFTVSVCCVLVLFFSPLPKVSFLDYYVWLSGF